METVRYTVQGLTDEAAAVDLANTITALNGVGGVTANPATHVITVEYDPHFANADVITNSIEKSGYPAQTA